MKEVVPLSFVGGLGDMFVQIFQRDTYLYLSQLNKPTDILLFSPNPYIGELLRNHPNQKNFRVHTFDQHPEFEKAHFGHSGPNAARDRNEEKQSFLRALLGAEYQFRETCPFPKGVELHFYLSRLEKFRLSLYARQRYVVVQPFGSARGKDIPAFTLKKILRELIQRNFRIYIVVRSNVRARMSMRPLNARAEIAEKVLKGLPGRKNVQIIEESVPMVLNLVQHASAFVGTDSAFIKAAWFYRKPSVLLFPETELMGAGNRQQYANSSGIYFGVSFDTTFHSTFEMFELERLQKFMDQHLPVVSKKIGLFR